MKYSRATTAVLGAEHVVPVELGALAKGSAGQRVTVVASQATWPRTVLREWAVADNNKQMLQEAFVVKQRQGLEAEDFRTADARAFLAKRVVAPGGWLLRFARLPCAMC